MLLSVADLQTGYGSLPVVHGVSLSVQANEVVAIVGPNGAGKTSTVKAISGQLPLMGGTVTFDGNDLGSVKAAARQALGMSVVPQSSNTFPDLTVHDNLTVSFSSMPRDAVAAAIDASFAMFPVLGQRHNQLAKTLSGGERQMLAFASGVGTDPRFIALDEPTTGLAPTIVDGLVEKILEFRSRGAAILWVIEEDPLLILPHVDRVYVLNAGIVQAEMDATELMRDTSLQSLFFGAQS
jgi:ABC-type branched-subunit amino acid transport system ATPase component